MKTFFYNVGETEYKIIIGQNAKENWDLVDNSDPDDLWFHLDEYPSAHVVISEKVKISEKKIFFTNLEDYPNQIIALAANYCKSNSKYGKNLHKAKIVYTQIKNLKKGKVIGSVIISKPNYINI